MAGSDKKSWGFYETPDWVAEKIAQNLVLNQRSVVVDLGAGTGALTKAIKSLYSNARSLGVEVDRSHHVHLKSVVDKIVSIDLAKKSISESSFPKGYQRTFVSNPPFGKVQMDSSVRQRLEEFELISPSTVSQNTRLEAVFLSEALRHSKKGANAAFILSASLLYHDFWRTLRKTLVNKHMLSKVMLLPSKAFKGTEVESAVVFLRPYSGVSDRIVVEDYRVGVNDSVIPKEAFEESFHEYTYPSEKCGLLGQFVKEIYRGRSCSKALSDNKIDHLHSSDISSLHKRKVHLSSKKLLANNLSERLAEAGDILIARVGTRCIGASVFVESGQAVISDSVISVRVPPRKRRTVFEKLSSEKGREWLCQAARGACAKILTYETIQRFPIGAI